MLRLYFWGKNKAMNVNAFSTRKRENSIIPLTVGLYNAYAWSLYLYYLFRLLRAVSTATQGKAHNAACLRLKHHNVYILSRLWQCDRFSQFYAHTKGVTAEAWTLKCQHLFRRVDLTNNIVVGFVGVVYHLYVACEYSCAEGRVLPRVEYAHRLIACLRFEVNNIALCIGCQGQCECSKSYIVFYFHCVYIQRLASSF